MTDSTKISAVLLVPAEGDPHGLISMGACWARPPTLAFTPDWDYENECALQTGSWAAPDYGEPGYYAPDDDEALVLAWDGKPVSEGCDRLRRRTGRAPFSALPRLSDAEHIGWRAAQDGFGTLILLDANGREVPCD